MNRYSLSSDSTRWWWPSGAAGAVCSAAIASLVLLPTTGAGSAAGYNHPGVRGGADASVGTSLDVPCFIQPLHWDVALDGPIPRCSLDLGAETETRTMQGTSSEQRDCPEPPDPRFVGVPWVAYTDECPELSDWWRR